MDINYSLNTDNLRSSLKSDQDADFVINMLKDKLQYYKIQNLQNEELLSSLQLTPDSLNSSCKDILNNFTKLQEASGVNSFESTDMEIAFLEIAKKKVDCKNELDKLHRYENDICQLIDDVNKETITIGKEVLLAETQIENIQSLSNVEINAKKLRIKSYEEKLLRYFEKYPWTNGPEYNILSIQEEIKKLYMLRDERDKLITSREIYSGLKPDVYAAKIQLSNIKNEYDTICKAIAEHNA